MNIGIAVGLPFANSKKRLFALSYDGVDDYVSIPNNELMNLQDNFSVEFEAVIKEKSGVIYSSSTTDAGTIGVLHINIDVNSLRFTVNGKGHFASFDITNYLNQKHKYKYTYNNGEIILHIDDSVVTTQTFDIGSFTFGDKYIGNGRYGFFQGETSRFTLFSGNTKIVEYLINEGQGSTLTDSINGINGTINGATWMEV